MASDEVKKKWGTIFMGDREASVEQLNALQEPLRREKQQKEQADDYMERVRSRAADRAREILGAAYAERQKVLEEARADAAARKKETINECGKMRAEGEAARRLAQAELEKAKAELQNAEKIRDAAHDKGYEEGMRQAAQELHEFRADLGQALASLLRAIERQRKDILEFWREDLVSLTRCAARAGVGYVLTESQDKILRALVFQSLDLLESRKTISIRVNPADEATVSDMFRAARERFPELGQWIVTGDEKIEKGGLVAESGSGSVDLRRENFREMVDGVLAHLALPEGDTDMAYENSVREIVEREVGRIASLTPEADRPAEEPEEAPVPQPEPAPAAAAPAADAEAGTPPSEETTAEMPAAGIEEAVENVAQEQEHAVTPPVPHRDSGEPSLEELEEELFPLGDESASAPVAAQKSDLSTPRGDADPDALAGGGFV